LPKQNRAVLSATTQPAGAAVQAAEAGGDKQPQGATCRAFA